MADAATIPVPNTAGDLQQWLSLFTGLFGQNTNSTSTNQSPEGLSAAMGILPMILNMVTAQDYSPGAAEKDSGPAVMLLLKQAMEQGMPAIAGAENSAGGYNSTTAALMRNDLSSRAAAEGAALIAKNKATYGALRTGQANSLISLINSIINASRVQTSSTSTGASPAARNAALGAAAAGGLANALKKPNNNLPVISRKPQKQPLLSPISSESDNQPGDLMMMLPPTERFGDNIQSMDDMPDMGGPTPEVTVENTGNMDIGANGSDNFGDLSGFDQSGDGIDLGAFGDPLPDSNPVEPDNGDWNFLDPTDPGNGGDLTGTEDAEEGF